MDSEVIRIAVDIAQFVITGAIGIYLYMERKHNAANKRLEKLEIDTETKMDDISERLGRMDERLKNAIGHPELEPIYSRMNSMDRTLGKMEGKMGTLDLIHEMLLKRGE